MQKFPSYRVHKSIPSEKLTEKQASGFSRAVLALCLGLASLMGGEAADAAELVQGDAFNVAANFAPAFVSFDGFDTSLGELNSVRFQLDAPSVVTLGTSFNPAPPPNTNVPLPYVFSYTAEHDLSSGTGIGYVNTGQWFGSLGASGAGESVPAIRGISVDATIDPEADEFGLTDTTGFDVPPTQLTGSLDDFQDQPILLQISLGVTITANSGPPVLVQDVSMPGAVTLTYDYTPIPEPSSGAVILVLAGSLMLRRHRR
jgi:hypothetical protein